MCERERDRERVCVCVRERRGGGGRDTEGVTGREKGKVGARESARVRVTRKKVE